MNRKIATYCGPRFDPFAPRVEDIHLRDIAHALANRCRFGGHCAHFYSVAQHSAEMARKARQPAHLLTATDEERKTFAKICLLHDAAEAYLTDIVRPLKADLGWRVAGRLPWIRGFVSYRAVEKRLDEAIGRKFGLERGCFGELLERFDERMLATERRDLFDARQPPWPMLTAPPFPERIYPMSPFLAEAFFMEVYEELYQRRS